MRLSPAEHTAQMRDKARRYAPGSMVEVLADFEEMPDAHADIADFWRALSEGAHDHMPLDPRVVEVINNCHRVALSLAEHAREIAPAIRALHAHDLERHENPRPGEHLWDVRRS